MSRFNVIKCAGKLPILCDYNNADDEFLRHYNEVSNSWYVKNVALHIIDIYRHTRKIFSRRLKFRKFETENNRREKFLQKYTNVVPIVMTNLIRRILHDYFVTWNFVHLRSLQNSCKICTSFKILQKIEIDWFFVSIFIHNYV